MKVLVVIDMQNDFIDGSLGSKEAVSIIPKAVEKIKLFEGTIIATRDSHEDNYLDTEEGRNLPVKHCIRGTKGYELNSSVLPLIRGEIIDKPTFGSIALGELLVKENQKQNIEDITLIGLCTDICVISNAMIIKAFLPEIPIIVDASCCAGVTPESHRQALEAMKMCQIKIINE